MGNVINLGRERKRKQREAAKRKADQNASKHGRKKAEKTRERKERAQLGAKLDGARLEPPKLAVAPPIEREPPNDSEPESPPSAGPSD